MHLFGLPLDKLEAWVRPRCFDSSVVIVAGSGCATCLSLPSPLCTTFTSFGLWLACFVHETYPMSAWGGSMYVHGLVHAYEPRSWLENHESQQWDVLRIW